MRKRVLLGSGRFTALDFPAEQVMPRWGAKSSNQEAVDGTAGDRQSSFFPLIFLIAVIKKYSEKIYKNARPNC